MTNQSLSGIQMLRLDHLRFYAASLLVFHHFRGDAINAPENLRSLQDFFSLWMAWGSTGVTLFIVLSGFLFCVLSNAGQRKINYSSFIKNRVLRIFPLVTFVFLIVTAVARDKMGPDDVFRLFLLQMNVGHSFTGYWHQYFPIGPIWTIAVEFQFYLMFPFLIVFFKLYGWRWLLKLIFLMMLIRAGLALQYDQMYFNIYHTLIGRLDQFMVGVATGFIFIQNKEKLISKKKSIFAFVVLLFAFSYVLMLPHDQWWFVSISFLLEAVLWAAGLFIYLQMSPFGTRAKRFSMMLANLGKLSFSIYILHLFIGGLVINVLGLETPTTLVHSFVNTALLVYPCIIITSFFTYHAIELPFLSLKSSYFEKGLNESVT